MGGSSNLYLPSSDHPTQPQGNALGRLGRPMGRLEQLGSGNGNLSGGGGGIVYPYPTGQGPSMGGVQGGGPMTRPLGGYSVGGPGPGVGAGLYGVGSQRGGNSSNSTGGMGDYFVGGRPMGGIINSHSQGHDLSVGGGGGNIYGGHAYPTVGHVGGAAGGSSNPLPNIGSNRMLGKSNTGLGGAFPGNFNAHLTGATFDEISTGSGRAVPKRRGGRRR